MAFTNSLTVNENHTSMGPIVTGICLIAAGVLLLFSKGTLNRVVGFLLATAGANEISADEAFGFIGYVFWLVMVLLLIAAVILEETGRPATSEHRRGR
jgi:hypothetical protein